jgi:hypothetical protein
MMAGGGDSSAAGPAVDASEGRGGRHVHGGKQCAQAAAQPLLDHRVVKGHLHYVLGIHPGLNRPGDQVGQVFMVRADHFSPQYLAGVGVAVDMQEAFVYQHHP